MGRRHQPDHWDLALIDAPIGTLLHATPEATRIGAAVPGVFRADPFAVVRAERTTLLFERYDQVARRGEIWTAELSAARSLEDERPALALPSHASYPFVVEEAGEVFCVPETSLLGEVSLYRAVAFPDRWVREAVLLRGRIADATVFRHHERWWLAGVSHDLDAGAATERLVLFYADALTGPYQPHRANPVRIDKRGARPAGTPFREGGRLFRPGQDCSRTYGGGVIVFEVEALNPHEYRERVAAALDGAAFGADGIHTLSAAGPRTLVDLKNGRGPPRSG